MTGGPGLFEQLGPITLLFETGRAVIIFGPEEFGRRRSEAPRTSLQVRPNLLVLPKLLEACNQQVDPRRGSPYILIVLAGSPAGRTFTITTRQKFLRADPGLEAVERGWNWLRRERSRLRPVRHNGGRGHHGKLEREEDEPCLGNGGQVLSR